MLIFRYYLLVAFTVIVLWWPFSYLLSCFFHKRRVARITKNMPAVDDHPFIGCAMRFRGKNNEEIMQVLQDLVLTNDTPFMFWLGPKNFLFIDHPDDIQAVFNAKECFEKSEVYTFFTKGVGLFGAPAHIWRPLRKQLSGSFNNQITWSFLPIFNEKANLFVRNIGRHTEKGEFDIFHYSACCALDIVCETVLGTQMKLQDGENGDYMIALDNWLSTIAKRMVNVFLHPDIIYKQTQTYRKETEWLARAEVMSEKVISQKIAEFQSGNNNENSIEDENESESQHYEKPQVFIDRLLKLHSKGLVTKKEMQEHAHLLIFAGHDTSTFTISTAILLLAMHSKIEQRVMDELNEVLGDQPLDVDLTMDQLNRLIYLEQVIKETLRLYPVAPVLLRYCNEDTKLPNFTIPKGTDIVISALSAHRRKDIWSENADEFNPNHFSKENCAKRNPHAFMAFSGGARNCMGIRFAIISIKIVLAKVFRKYRFSTPFGMEDVKFRLEVTCKPTNGIILEVENRL